MFTNNGPINLIDTDGRDIWIGKGGSNQTGIIENVHQNINVGDPCGDYDSYSFGAKSHASVLPLGDDGVVYKNPNNKDTPVEGKCLKTTPEEDKKAKEILDNMVGEEMPYQLIGGTCRSFSQDMFEFFEEDMGFGKEGDSGSDDSKKDCGCEEKE